MSLRSVKGYAAFGSRITWFISIAWFSFQLGCPAQQNSPGNGGALTNPPPKAAATPSEVIKLQPGEDPASGSSEPTVNHRLANGLVFSTTLNLKQVDDTAAGNRAKAGNFRDLKAGETTGNPSSTNAPRIRTLAGFAASSQSLDLLGPVYEDIKFRYKPGELLGPRANPSPIANLPFMVNFLQQFNPFAPAIYGSSMEADAAHDREFGEIPSPTKRWP